MSRPSSAMAEEQAGGQAGGERRARQKPMFTVPIITVVLLIVAPCALFLFTSDVALPRIRIEYVRRDVPAASAPVNLAPPPSVEAAVAVSRLAQPLAPEAAVAVPIEEQRREEQQPLPPVRQLTDRPYSLGPAVPDYDARRASWLAAHPGFPAYVAPGRPRVLVVTGSSPRRCSDPEGDHVLLRAFKNKADYCRVHGFDIFYSNAVLDAEMSGFWTKLPLLRALMVAHPETELLWWVDSDVVFTDMLFEPPWGKYAAHNLVIHGWDEAVYGARNWMGTNAGSFVIRNCRWSLDLLDAWAKMGPRGPVRDKYGKIFAEALSNRAAYEADDQSALVYLLATQRDKWADKVFLESSYLLHGYWKAIVDRYEEMRSKWRPGLGDDRWPLVTHFVGCKPCGEQGASYEASRCRQGMERALNFADDQILKLYGFQHESLNTTAVRRVRNDTGRPMDADDDEIGRLLHPTFRAAKP
ncbi:probable glycosyltransferase 4 [Lolium perenne]|uniref:probable glycosyltransferase 4 n=1 Tax=Lolium perenne TaxID=4522 RepID=UPI0021EA2B16|nr:probable glycosyltransferase 4 [Lolium perenne]